MNHSEFKQQSITLLNSIRLRIDDMMNAFYSPYGLTTPQATTLMYLHKNGPQKICTLAKSLHMTNSNLSAICQRLEARHLIERIRDEDDQRVVMAVLTPHAVQILEEVEEKLNTDYLPILQCAHPEDQEIILSGLQKLDQLLNSNRKESFS